MCHPHRVCQPYPVVQPDDEKSPALATSLAVAGTLVPLAIAYTGIHDRDAGVAWTGVLMIALTPSAGHWYVGQLATPGMGMRVAGLAMFALGASISSGSDGESTGVGFAIGGLLLGAGGSLYDICTAGNEAEAYNRNLRVHVQPTAMRFHDGYGLGLAGTF